MAERRMFAKTIIDSDAFLDMPISARLLYYDLGMRADDDGFINNPKKVQRMVNCSEDDLKLLIGKRFIIPFKSGVVVIKHWKIHNYIRKDRYNVTVYQEEKNLLTEKKNGSYSTVEGYGLPDDNQRLTQVRLGKVRLGNTYDDFFNQVWKLYPKKEGIGQVSKTQKEKLYHIGIEEITRAINRYEIKIKNEKIERKFIKQGSTFFNSGYIDYLDANYEDEPVKPKNDFSKLNII